MSDAPPEPPPVSAATLARAVLLFHRGGRWALEDRMQWLELTGSKDATTKVLCGLARRLLDREDNP